jgi:signal transduction histidine kinase
MEQEKRSLLDITFQKFMDVGFGQGNLDMLDDIVARDVVGIGTAIDEKLFGINALKDLLIRQNEQSAGMEVSWKINTLDIHISLDENTAIYTNDLILYLTIDGNTIEMYLRFSVVLEYVQSKWMVVHWHGSKPEHVESEKDTWGIETWKEKAEALEKQVLERTADLLEKNRELEIEAALEKVRAVAIGMKKPEDMLDVCRIISDQLQQFLVDKIRNVQTAIINKDIGQYLCYQYFPAYEQTTIEDTIYHKSPVEHDMVRQMLKSKDGYFIGTLSGKELDEFRMHRKSENQFADPLLDEASELSYCFLSIGEGGLGLSLYQDLDEDVLDIFKRFHQVFSMAYQRFRDIQKAEAQAREAKIEVALERTRTQSMLMQHSDEIKSISNVFHEQLLNLGIPSEFSYVWLPDEATLSHQFWASWFENEEGENLMHSKQVTYPLDKTEPYTAACFAAWANLEIILEEFIPPTEISDFFDVWQELLAGASELKAEFFPDGIYYSEAYMRYGCFGINIQRKLSEEEKHILKRFSIEFERAYTRFLDLKKAEAQTREAKIEAALEKVRSRTMGMQQSNELADVANVLFGEMNHLVHNLWTCGFVLCERDRQEDEWWLSLEDGFSRGFFLPNVNDFAHATLYEGWLVGETFRTVQLDGDMLQGHYDWLLEIPVAKNIFDDMEAAGMKRPDWQKLHAAYFSKGYLVLITREPCGEEEIFKRFAQVFDQTYTRFLDLQKAEEQAKEAQIEAGLERVRSAAMAMHRSYDLRFSLTKVFEELDKLNLAMIRCGIAIVDPSKPRADVWIMAKSGDNNIIQLSGDEPLDTNFMLIEAYEAWKKGNDYEYTLEGEKISEYYSSLDQNEFQADLSSTFSNEIKTRRQHYFNAFFKHGSLFAFFEDQMPDSGRTILKRFSNVLNLAYSRFHDIQFAEAQAREAQIENALEKVRSRSLAMQNPEELVEVAVLLREEMGHLGVEELETSSIYLVDYGIIDAECWYAIKDIRDGNKEIVSDEMTLSLNETWVGQEMLKFFNSEVEQASIVMIGDNRKEWINYCANRSQVLQGYYGDEIPERTYHLVKFKGGYLGAASPGEISSESWDLLKRATSVFSFAYTRFLDLRKAEGQAQEAKIELSLERIRSKVTSMQESSDLLDIVVSMRSEFVKLGHEAHYFWHMSWLPKTYEKAMTSGDGTKIGMVMTLPRHIHGDIAKVAKWEKSNEPTHVLAMDAETAVEYVHKMITLGDFERVDPQAPTLDDIRHIGGLTFVMARTTHGEIGYSLPGVVHEPSKDAVDTLMRFAGVFDLAYKRFEDLKTAEKDLIEIKAAREKAEEALLELKATQSQLIQHEKLASLGQLTAGIAHEIKNPLNFVNNFSEVSLELIEEVMEELKAQGSAPQETITEILKDIESNLRKIHEHGTRANSIVTSMLQHSRGGSGNKEPTDLNALVKEYVNLCFHGMRAAKNPINVSISVDLDPEIHEVSLIHEDFTRVIINLCNNAFDAMRQKKLLNPEDYQPKLSVRTKSDRDDIVIEVEDNGEGIPGDIKDKILQPFFTTKKGTEGTGLGLSITHDIIKAHGGELTIETAINKGTSFIIKLNK